jgi:ABC-type nitrate/sulfonate/bicarbonate transport system permease component
LPVSRCDRRRLSGRYRNGDRHSRRRSAAHPGGAEFRRRPLRIVATVRLPASVPMVFASLRLAAGMSLLLVVSAETIAAAAGIGYPILYAGDLMQTPRLLAGTVVLSVLGLVSTGGLAALERRLFRGRARAV